MEFTVVITKKPDTLWRAEVPGYVEFEAEAETRDQAIEQIKDRIVEAMSCREIVRIEVPIEARSAQNLAEPLNNRVFTSIRDSFGVFRDDPTLDDLFDEIERQRDQLMVIAGQTVEVTQTLDKSWRAVVTSHPDCVATAETRDEVLDRIEQRITDSLPRNEEAHAEVALASD